MNTDWFWKACKKAAEPIKPEVAFCSPETPCCELCRLAWNAARGHIHVPEYIQKAVKVAREKNEQR